MRFVFANSRIRLSCKAQSRRKPFSAPFRALISFFSEKEPLHRCTVALSTVLPEFRNSRILERLLLRHTVRLSHTVRSHTTIKFSNLHPACCWSLHAAAQPERTNVPGTYKSLTPKVASRVLHLQPPSSQFHPPAMHSTLSLTAFAHSTPATLPTFTRPPRLALTTLAMKRKLTTPEEHAAKRRQTPLPPPISSPHQTPPSPHPAKIRSWTQHQCARVADTVSQELKAIATPQIDASQSVYMRNIVRKSRTCPTFHNHFRAPATDAFSPHQLSTASRRPNGV